MRIDLAGWTREATFGDHGAFMALFEQADRLGFDGVWFNEFHFHQPVLPYPSTLLLAAAIFARTSRLRIGTSVLVLPLYHPLMLAEQIAQLDGQSGGRLDVGIGRGTEPAALAALGIAPSETRARFERGFALLRQALAETTVASDDGPWRFDRVAVGPRPVQRPHPPFYLAGSTRETLAFAIAEDLPLLFSLEPPEGRQLGLYRDILATSGQPGALARSSLSRYVCIGATAAAAEARLDTLLARRRERRLARGLVLNDDGAFRRAQAVVGTAAACVAQIRALATETGVDALRCIFNGNGTIDNATALADMGLFADEALPGLR
jgi:alkanesulfonate monooxygenase SsuD/methylene tetrahydromethanopterin reductase-like flavin-dependent oxidoreductase (luciferase family)